LKGCNCSHVVGCDACAKAAISRFKLKKYWSVLMRRIPLSLAAACALVVAASPAQAGAMSVATAPAIEAAIAGTGVVQEIVYVCRHRYYSRRRVCWWQPGYRPWRHRHRRGLLGRL
jgi:hypothetical protein